MPKRFLNVEYDGTKIEITEMEDLSEVRRAIKAKFANSLAQVDAALIQLYTAEKDQLITDLDDIPPQCYQKLNQGGSCVVIGTLPPPSRQTSRYPFLTGSSDWLEGFPGKNMPSIARSALVNQIASTVDKRAHYSSLHHPLLERHHWHS